MCPSPCGHAIQIRSHSASHHSRLLSCSRHGPVQDRPRRSRRYRGGASVSRLLVARPRRSPREPRRLRCDKGGSRSTGQVRAHRGALAAASGQHPTDHGRFYDPAIQQFLSGDPDVAETGPLYLLTGEDSLNAADPLGVKPWYIDPDLPRYLMSVQSQKLRDIINGESRAAPRNGVTNRRWWCCGYAAG